MRRIEQEAPLRRFGRHQATPRPADVFGPPVKPSLPRWIFVGGGFGILGLVLTVGFFPTGGSNDSDNASVALPSVAPVEPTTSSSTTSSTTSPAVEGAVLVGVGVSIQGLVDAHPAETVFLVEAGVHRRQTVRPKDGDQFIGEPGAVLDGEGATEYAFLGSADNVLIEGLVIRDYSPPVQHCAVEYVSRGRDWTVRGNEFTGNMCAIFAFHGWQIVNNYIHHQRQLGIKGVGEGIVVDGNEISANNTDGYDPHWEAGGTKFFSTTNLVVRNNNVHDNGGPGLWTDYENRNVLYENNTARDNFGPGIFHEISHDAVIRGNLVEGNGFGYTAWLDGAGILIMSSSNVEVFGNTVRNNNDGIGGIHDERGPGLRNLYVHDNTIVLSSGKTGIVTGQTNDVFTSWNNRFANNHYTTSISEPFNWLGDSLTWDQWQANGQDTQGSYN